MPTASGHRLRRPGGDVQHGSCRSTTTPWRGPTGGGSCSPRRHGHGARAGAGPVHRGHAEGRQRTVLFVTDGQSTDEERLMQLLWQRKGTGRVFPLGIDRRSTVRCCVVWRVLAAGFVVHRAHRRHRSRRGPPRRFGAPLVEGVRIEGRPVPVPASSPVSRTTRHHPA